MTRNLMAVAAAVALLGSGYGSRSVTQAADDWDEESRLKRRALEEGCQREREAMHEAAQKRVAERRRQTVEAEARKTDDFDKLRAGIDPTNGRPLSRQQRRFLSRRNFPFHAASADTHRNGGDAKLAPALLSGAVGSEADETPQ